MKKISLLLLTVALSTMCYSQTAVSAYTWSGSSWIKATSTGTYGQVGSVPGPPAFLYCWNNSLAKWVKADSSCFGGGSSGTVSGQAGGVIPLASAASAITLQSGISINTSSLATPSAPTVTTTCTSSCTSTWKYGIVEVNAFGTSATSPLANCTSMNNTPSSTNHCDVTFPTVAGVNCAIYRDTNGQDLAGPNGQGSGLVMDPSTALFVYLHACDGSVFQDNGTFFAFQTWAFPFNPITPTTSSSSTGAHYADRISTQQIGLASVATGQDAYALGSYTNSAGSQSTALGTFADAVGDSSIAIGSAQAVQGFDIAIGPTAYANGGSFGTPAVAFGWASTATGANAFAFGDAAVASSNNSIAIGDETAASGDSSVAIGFTVRATANKTVAIAPSSMTNSSANTSVIGAWNPTQNASLPGLTVQGDALPFPSYNPRVLTFGIQYQTASATTFAALTGAGGAGACSAGNVGLHVAIIDSPSSAVGTVVTSGGGTFTVDLECISNSTGPTYSWVIGGGTAPAASGTAGGVLSGTYPNPGLSASAQALPNGWTATTQSQSDNSTKVATTAYVDALAPVNAAITSATGGTGTGTVTCVTAACTNISGTYSVAGGTFTTGNLLVLVWPTTTTVYRCWTSQNGGAATFGIGHSVATATGMTITSGISVLGVTVTIDYGCSKY